jgi:hypothetical protein
MSWLLRKQEQENNRFHTTNIANISGRKTLSQRPIHCLNTNSNKRISSNTNIKEYGEFIDLRSTVIFLEV